YFYTYINEISFIFFFSSRRRHTRFKCDWSSDVCSSDLIHLLKYVSKWIGRAQYQKPNMALLELRREDKREIWEKWVCSGSAIYRSEERRVGKECRARW